MNSSWWILIEMVEVIVTEVETAGQIEAGTGAEINSQSRNRLVHSVSSL
jgi:hypothetical protein